jgi:hypothetical protein
MRAEEVVGLLDIAQRALEAQLTPTLSRAPRLQALMIASAMRIAARALVQTEALAQARAALAQAAAGEDLAQAIRAGRRDADASLHALLWAEAVLRCGVTKPAFLTRAERRLAGMPEASDR